MVQLGYDSIKNIHMHTKRMNETKTWKPNSFSLEAAIKNNQKKAHFPMDLYQCSVNTAKK